MACHVPREKEQGSENFRSLVCSIKDRHDLFGPAVPSLQHNQISHAATTLHGPSSLLHSDGIHGRDAPSRTVASTRTIASRHSGTGGAGDRGQLREDRARPDIADALL